MVAVHQPLDERAEAGPFQQSGFPSGVDNHRCGCDIRSGGEEEQRRNGVALILPPDDQLPD